MIKAVIFDMDGLMFDTERLTISAWDFAGEQIGVGKLGYMVYKTLGMTVESSREIFKQEFGELVQEETLMKYTSDFFNEYYKKNGMPVKTGLYELLDFLRENNYKIGAATSSREKTALHHFELANITSYFDAVVCGDMIHDGKPSPEIYIKACIMLEVEPNEAIALEDSKNGIRSAFSAGLMPVMIPDLIEPDDDISKMLFARCDDLNQVIKLIKDIK